MMGLMSLSGLLFVAWIVIVTSMVPSSPPISAATKPKATDVAAEENAETRVKLNYFSASWARVFQDLAETGDMEIVADKMPHGRFSRTDRTMYTRAEAIRIVNKELEEQGLRLIEKGQFLILIEVHTQKPNYPPAVLPRKPSPNSAQQHLDEAAAPRRMQSETVSAPREKTVDRAGYQESALERRYDATDRRTSPVRQAASRNGTHEPRPVRQASLDESNSDTAPARGRHIVENDLATEMSDVGDAAPHTTYRTKNLSAVELSKRVYRAMKSEAELLDSGRFGLPAFRVNSPEFKSTDPAASKTSQPVTIEFMISIDEARNELLIDGTAKSVDAILKLLKIIDRPANQDVQTQIKATSKYVCQVADQLPAEIDRLRAAANSRTVARHAADGKPVWLADENQRRIPEDGQDDVPPPNEKAPSRDPSVEETLGNFKGEVNIEVIDDLNVMIIRGNQRDVDQIMKVIKQIETLSEATAPEVHLIHLKNVDSESLAELLTSVYEKLTKFPGRATQPHQSVAIIPVSKPNALLIVAPGAEVESILDLADQLDRPVDPQTEFQVFQLKAAIATDIQEMITEFYKERKALGAKVLVIADSRSNSVIVRARPRDLDEIKELIVKMDRDEVGAVNQVRIFVLKNGVATEMAAVINSAIQSVLAPPRAASNSGQNANLGLGGGQIDEQFKGVKSSVLQFLTVEKGTSRQLRSGILSDIRVTPDAHANSLIVTASENSMELIAALIQTLDRPTNTVSVIKVFTLENADANQMVQQLNALFNGQPQGAGNAIRQQLGIALANADDASSSLVPMKFSVDTRTNSVIATGSADALRVVEAILLRLDESNLRARVNEVVRLNNAPATLIAAAVTQFFQQQRDLSQTDPNLVSNVEQVEREVIVIPDTVSNNLLVSSTPRYMPAVLKMIAKLDSEPKQVVIQAMIVEVQLNNTDEFGIELGLQSPVLFDRSTKDQPVVLTTTSTPIGQTQVTSQTLLSQAGSPGFNFNNPGVPLGNNILAAAGTVGGQSLTNFSLGRTNSDLGYGGLVLSAGSNSVNALLRALSASRKIQILSRPQIRALDSQAASVFVGQNIPTVTAFNTNATTGVISPILTQQPTGIGMDVTPRINQDGNIVIQLYAYRSQLSKETVNVTTDSRGQPVGQRITDLSNVRSTVLVPSNSTIVIGGMISSRDEASIRKAPFLGDLPIVGHLFRYDSRASIRSELLIFLTPRVVNGPIEEECLKDIEMGRIHFIESEAEAMHGPLRAIPAEEVFDEGERWVAPGSIVAPGADLVPPQPTPLNPIPSNTVPQARPTELPPGTPTELPPAKPTQPNQPPSESAVPPAPDSKIQQLNALRSAAIETDDTPPDRVTTASWTAPESDKKKSKKSKR